MNEDKVLNLLGLAQRAGKLCSGDFIVEKAMKKKNPKLVLLAGDCAAIGKEVRVVVAVEDDGFAKALLKEIDQ